MLAPFDLDLEKTGEAERLLSETKSYCLPRTFSRSSRIVSVVSLICLP